ncbi:Iron/zinc purple acid phosphatase-like C-terminal domain-containing protein [Artemisia annua]|uniref:Iron/zinc purple acid phosphatase-like C-terminal domain-containing protein n=1 Tax=Artemisia annua TaxID=35608 RepID=A0A2U1PIH2_ARTAN|nr:Iron/zinc purple acid phosphatase-like C-terminal domain-containing protein [Artemisia annua]
MASIMSQPPSSNYLPHQYSHQQPQSGGDTSAPVVDSADTISAADIGQSMDVDPVDGVACDLGPTSTVPEPSIAAPSGEDPPIFIYGRTFVVSNDAPTTDIQGTSTTTLIRYALGSTKIHVGDLSYADRYQYHDMGVRWDTLAVLSKKIVKKLKLFRLNRYLYRYTTPYDASESSNPLWYAVRRASAHIIVLYSYSPFDLEDILQRGWWCELSNPRQISLHNSWRWRKPKRSHVKIQYGEKRKSSSKTQEVDNVEEVAGSESEGDESHQEDDKKNRSRQGSVDP